MASYYVTVVRGRRVGWLAGPFHSDQLAREQLLEARRIAEEIDPFCHFDLFGTASVERENPPPGVLNARLGIN